MAMRHSAKSILRKQMKHMLQNNLSSLEMAVQSKDIAAKLCASTMFRISKRVCIYLSTSSEVDTTSILSALFNYNKEVFVPYYAAESMVMLRLYNMNDYEMLPLTKWKIRQPSQNDVQHRENALETGGLDLIILPGVAFNAITGARLGHGMGYYDRFVVDMYSKCPERASHFSQRGQIGMKLGTGKSILIGLAFKEQIISEVPCEEHDVLLDLILTPTSCTSDIV